MPSGRSYSWHTHQSDGPVIIEREPNFANPFKSKKSSVPVVRQQICRRPRGPDRVEVVEVREPTREPGESREPTPMSRGGRHEDYVPLPPRIPTPRHDPIPIIEMATPRERERPEIHHPRRHSFDLPMDRPPVRIPDPDRIAHERDLRRQASHQAKLETRRRKEAERETARARQAAARDAERLREVNDFAEHCRRMAINERENRREAESEARRLAAQKREAEERARQAEYELGRERQLTEMAILQARLRQVEMEDRVDDEEYPIHRRPVRIVQPEMPFSVDRGTAVLREAQEAERQRREDELRYRMERDRRRGLPRRQRSITIFEDDTSRRRRHRI